MTIATLLIIRGARLDIFKELSSMLAQLSSAPRLYWICDAHFIPESLRLCRTCPTPSRIYEQFTGNPKTDWSLQHFVIMFCKRTFWACTSTIKMLLTPQGNRKKQFNNAVRAWNRKLSATFTFDSNFIWLLIILPVLSHFCRVFRAETWTMRTIWSNLQMFVLISCRKYVGKHKKLSVTASCKHVRKLLFYFILQERIHKSKRSLFLKKCSSLLSALLRFVFEESLAAQTLSLSMCQAEILLIPKIDKDLLNCGSCRPISLLNTDVKIFQRSCQNDLSGWSPQSSRLIKRGS